MEDSKGPGWVTFVVQCPECGAVCEQDVKVAGRTLELAARAFARAAVSGGNWHAWKCSQGGEK